VVGDVPRRLCSVTASVVCTWFCSVGTINCGIYIRMKSDVSGSIFWLFLSQTMVRGLLVSEHSNDC